MFKMEQIKSPNCVYGDGSHDYAEPTFFRCHTFFQTKVSARTIDNFCNVILCSEENWNSMASYIEALLESKKFDLDVRDVEWTSRQLL